MGSSRAVHASAFSSEPPITVSPPSLPFHGCRTLQGIPRNDRQPDDSVAWTIWTINESANYIFAACLPTLRPLFLRILPSSFFILSKPQLSAQKVSPTPESPASDCVLKEERSRRRDCLRGNEHPSLYDECWVDMEASRPSIDDSTLKVVTTVSEIEIPIISRT